LKKRDFIRNTTQLRPDRLKRKIRRRRKRKKRKKKRKRRKRNLRLLRRVIKAKSHLRKWNRLQRIGSLR